MAGILELIQMVPSTVWSALLGAFIAFSGTMISNSSNTKKLRIQLEHDAMQKEKDRFILMRREIYLKTIASLNEVHGKLIGIAKLDPSETDLSEGFQPFFSSAAQLQLVAESDTSTLVNDLVAEYALLIMRCISCATPVIDVRTEIARSEHLLEMNQSKFNLLSEEILQLGRGREIDQHVLHVLKTSMHFHQQQIQTLQLRIGSDWEKWNALHKDYVEYVLEELRKISATQIPAFVKVRLDFGLSTDATVIAEQLRKNYLRLRAQMDSSGS